MIHASKQFILFLLLVLDQKSKFSFVQNRFYQHWPFWALIKCPKSMFDREKIRLHLYKVFGPLTRTIFMAIQATIHNLILSLNSDRFKGSARV